MHSQNGHTSEFVMLRRLQVTLLITLNLEPPPTMQPGISSPCRITVERQAQRRPDRLKKPRTGSVGTDRLGRGPDRLGPIG